jgi:hypothetical protein
MRCRFQVVLSCRKGKEISARFSEIDAPVRLCVHARDGFPNSGGFYNLASNH